MGWPVILVLVLVISAWLWKSVRKAKKFPPGPPRWVLGEGAIGNHVAINTKRVHVHSSRLPIVGGLPFLVSGRETFLKDVLRAVSKYGKVFGFYISDTKCIVVSEYELLKELFKKEELASRPPFEPFNESRPGYKFPGDGI